MRKGYLRITSLMLAVFTVMSLCAVNVVAAEDSPDLTNAGVTPRLNNGADVFSSFYISSDGIADVNCEVIGCAGLTTGIIIEIQLQRKGLLWWSDVDGGYWYESFSGVTGTLNETVQLTKTGKYRAVITVTVSGTGGADDVIEDTLTYEY
ncbi:MAG: hypothetical protein IJN63_04070 [Clostridia bacterium]|nr:hypothetical protein [Clostridia bacterium]